MSRKDKVILFIAFGLFGIWFGVTCGLYQGL